MFFGTHVIEKPSDVFQVWVALRITRSCEFIRAIYMEIDSSSSAVFQDPRAMEVAQKLASKAETPEIREFYLRSAGQVQIRRGPSPLIAATVWVYGARRELAKVPGVAFVLPFLNLPSKLYVGDCFDFRIETASSVRLNFGLPSRTGEGCFEWLDGMVLGPHRQGTARLL